MSKNEKKRSATTEEEIFEKVKNFPADLEKRKIELKTLKEKKEHEQWLKALGAMQTAMFQSIEYGLDFKCKECFTEFISCYRCEKDGGQVEIDYLENDKGSFCAKCEKHFCTMHGQNTGGFKEMSGLEEVWFCEDCF